MSRIVESFGTISIASSGTTSTELKTATGFNAKVAFGALVDLIIYAPSALTGTVTVQIAYVESPSSGDWKNLYVGGSAVTVPAGAAVVIPAAAFRALRLSSGSAEGAQRDFVVWGQLNV